MKENTNSLIIKYSAFPVPLLALSIELLDWWKHEFANYFFGGAFFVCGIVFLFYGVGPRINRDSFNKIDKKIKNNETLKGTELYLLSWRSRFKKFGAFIED